MRLGYKPVFDVRKIEYRVLGAANLALHTASKVLIMQVLRTGVKTHRDIFAHQKPSHCAVLSMTPQIMSQQNSCKLAILQGLIVHMLKMWI